MRELWLMVKTEALFSMHCLGQNTFDLGKLTFLPNKIDLSRDKWRQTLKQVFCLKYILDEAEGLGGSIGPGWHQLELSMTVPEQPLASFHRDHPCSPTATKTLPHAPNTASHCPSNVDNSQEVISVCNYSLRTDQWGFFFPRPSARSSPILSFCLQIPLFFCKPEWSVSHFVQWHVGSFIFCKKGQFATLPFSQSTEKMTPDILYISVMTSHPTPAFFNLFFSLEPSFSS